MTIDDIMRENEEREYDVVDGTRDNIRESKYGMLKLIAFDTLPITLGAACGGIARATGWPGFIAVLPAMSLMTSFGPSHSPRAIGKSLLGWAGYAVGAALPYADVIFQGVADKL